MKNFKIYMAALLFGAMTLASCSDKYYITFENNSQYTVNNNTYEGGGNGGSQELPDIPDTDNMKPAAGQVTILINIGDLDECHGIGVKGCLNGSDWSGENTYIGAESSQVAREDAIRFELYKDGSSFWKATYTLGSAGIQGKVCQFYTGDSGWQGQATGVTVDADLTTLVPDVDYTINDEGQFNVLAEAAAGVLVLNITGWNKTECAAAEPVATEAYIKHAGNGWAWEAMTATATPGVFTYEGTWGNNGCNINTAADDAGAEWYPMDDSRCTIADGLAEGDAVIYTFTSTAGNIGTVKVDKK